MCSSTVLEDSRISLRYWIYTLIITTYCRNKRGFYCGLSFCRFSSSPSSILFSFSPPYYPGSLRIFFFPFLLVPQKVSNPLPFAYFSPTSLSSTRLHCEFQLRITPRNIIVILLDLLTFQKVYITIYLFICSTYVSRCVKKWFGFFNQLGPWWVSFLLRTVCLKTDPMWQE